MVIISYCLHSISSHLRPKHVPQLIRPIQTEEILSLAGLFIPSSIPLLSALPLWPRSLSLSPPLPLSLTLLTSHNLLFMPLVISVLLPVDSLLIPVACIVCLFSCLAAQTSSLCEAGPAWTWPSWTLMPPKWRSALSRTSKHHTQTR